MILTPHLLLGAAIASRISNPFLALPLALISHFLLDSLPTKEYSVLSIREKHWGKTFPDFIKVFLDIAFGISLILLFSRDNAVIFAAAFLAIAPDAITILNENFPKNKLFIQHQKIHMAANCIFDPKSKKIPAFWGVLSQVAVAAIAILFLK